MNSAIIAERIKHLCKQKKVTVLSVLLACDVNKNFIYDLEKGGSSPSADKLYRIADYFDCSVDYLLGRSDTP